MDKLIKLVAVVVLSSFLMSYGAEYNLKSITTTMDAYKKRTDCIRMKYTCKSPKLDEEGNREFVKGTFAQNKSEGYVLLDEKKQRGKAWDNDKPILGHARSYDGQITRYLEHELNSNGHFQAALFKNHDPKSYLSRNNPYYRVWGNNYKRKFTELLNDPNGMAQIQGEELVNGVKTVKIKYRTPEGFLDCHLWLLPEKNYLPLQYALYNAVDGKRIWKANLSEFREFSGGIWYPMKIELYHRDLAEPTTIKIQEMDISPLTKDDFEFDFPASTHVTDHLNGTSYLIED